MNLLPYRRKHFRSSFVNQYSNNLGGTNEYVFAADNNAFSFGDGAGNDSPFSFSIWMKRTSSVGNEILISKFGSAGAQEWYVFLVGTTLRFGVWAPSVATYIMRTAPVSDTGSWVNIIGTYSGNKLTSGIKIYKNAVQVDDASLTSGAYAGMTNTASILTFGATSIPGNYFIGKLAHPAIFNKELSGAEVTEIYDAKMTDLRNTSVNANLIGAWYFPNGTTDHPTYTDYVNGRNGTMQNQESTDIDTDIPT